MFFLVGIVAVKLGHPSIQLQSALRGRWDHILQQEPRCLVAETVQSAVLVVQELIVVTLETHHGHCAHIHLVGEIFEASSIFVGVRQFQEEVGEALADLAQYRLSEDLIQVDVVNHILEGKRFPFLSNLRLCHVSGIKEQHHNAV